MVFLRTEFYYGLEMELILILGMNSTLIYKPPFIGFGMVKKIISFKTKPIVISDFDLFDEIKKPKKRRK